MIQPIHRAGELERIEGKARRFLALVFHRPSSSGSVQALERLGAIVAEQPELPVYSVDVAAVPDIHGRFGVASVPTVVILKEGRMTNQATGLQSREYYELLLSAAPAPSRSAEDGVHSHQVVIYTSPTCSWCGAVKAYLRKNRISYREVDISRDEGAARTLVRRSGQMGVPQTEIDGKIIVGFNQAALDRQLGICGD